MKRSLSYPTSNSSIERPPKMPNLTGSTDSVDRTDTSVPLTEQIDRYIEMNGTRKDLVQKIISSHDIGYGWRFGQTQIKDSYRRNYKLTALHKAIEAEYGRTKAMLPVYNRLIEGEMRLGREARLKVSRDMHLHNAERLGARVADLNADVTFGYFEEEVKDILAEYSKCRSTKRILSFRAPVCKMEVSHATRRSITEGSQTRGGIRQSVDWDVVSETSESDASRERLVEVYITIASKYVWMSITKIRPKLNTIECFSCNATIEKNDESVVGLIVCQNCHADIPVTFNNSLIRDELMHVQTKDDSIFNFESALRKYMGLQDPPPTSLITRLNEYMQSRNYPTKEEVWDLPLDEYNKRGDTSCKMLIDALSTLREVGHYEDVHLIGSMLWNWALPNIRHLKETILYHFRATQKVFQSTGKDERGRNSSLGIQFRLYAHLWAVGLKCRFEDFKIPTSSLSLGIHMANWRYMCKNCGVPELESKGELPTIEHSSKKVQRISRGSRRIAHLVSGGEKRSVER